MPPDEAKKRQERRERNKEAAARCRRRREDLTSNLTEVTYFKLDFFSFRKPNNKETSFDNIENGRAEKRTGELASTVRRAAHGKEPLGEHLARSREVMQPESSS